MRNDAQICAFVARHGRTVLNKENCFRGNKNPELDEKGVRQAHKLAELFSHIDILCVVSSDKKRASETARIIAAAKGVAVHSTPALRALDVGDFSGLERTSANEASLQTYIEKPDVCIPGGESLNDFKSRINPCFKEAIELFEETGTPPLLVGHSSIIHQVGDWLYQNHKKILVDPGGCVALYYQNGKLEAEPIFLPAATPPGVRSDTVS